MIPFQWKVCGSSSEQPLESHALSHSPRKLLQSGSPPSQSLYHYCQPTRTMNASTSAMRLRRYENRHRPYLPNIESAGANLEVNVPSRRGRWRCHDGRRALGLRRCRCTRNTGSQRLRRRRGRCRIRSPRVRCGSRSRDRYRDRSRC